MSVVAIVRNGEGRGWLFASRAAADEHPLVQYGDAIVTEPGDVLRQYTRFDLPRLARRFAPRSDVADLLLPVVDAYSKDGSAACREAVERVLPTIFDWLIAASEAPPSDPAEVFRLIVADRQVTKRMAERENPRTSAASAKPHENEEDDMTEKRDHVRIYDDATIVFGKDKDGNLFGKDNLGGSKKTAVVNVLTKATDGMTVADALKAGLDRSDIRRARRAGFITVEGGTAPVKPEKAANDGAKADEAKGEQAAA